jgi:hypothetical protein
MSAKRHHWWPLAQSRYWTDASGQVTVTRSDGTTFRTSPINVGVESELYTRFLDDDTKSTDIEDWFAETIDGPATKLIEHLLDPANVTRKPFRGDPTKAETVRALGFRVYPYIDRIVLPSYIRRAISEYVAALLVRHPHYVEKLTNFHRGNANTSKAVKNLALSNMIYAFQLYVERISTAMFIVTRRTGSSEYLYTDGGLKVEEPWAADIPFDVHAPITPDISLQVLPVPLSSPEDLHFAVISEATNQGVARQNRIVLGGATRFVFSRGQAPVEFIKRYFGQPAPKNIGREIKNGRLHTWFEPNRT